MNLPLLNTILNQDFAHWLAIPENGSAQTPKEFVHLVLSQSKIVIATVPVAIHNSAVPVEFFITETLHDLLNPEQPLDEEMAEAIAEALNESIKIKALELDSLALFDFAYDEQMIIHKSYVTWIGGKVNDVTKTDDRYFLSATDDEWNAISDPKIKAIRFHIIWNVSIGF